MDGTIHASYSILGGPPIENYLSPISFGGLNSSSLVTGMTVLDIPGPEEDIPGGLYAPGAFSDTDVPFINGHIALANETAGGAGSSVGWVDTTGGDGIGALAVGGQLQKPSGFDPTAAWMWYDPNGGGDAFNSDGGPNGEFLIFRRRLGEISGLVFTPEEPGDDIPEPATAALAALAGATLLTRRLARRST